MTKRKIPAYAKMTYRQFMAPIKKKQHPYLILTEEELDGMLRQAYHAGHFRYSFFKPVDAQGRNKVIKEMKSCRTEVAGSVQKARQESR